MMRFKAKLFPWEKGWHSWFAWRPVQIENSDGTHQWVWLETVSLCVTLGRIGLPIRKYISLTENAVLKKDVAMATPTLCRNFPWEPIATAPTDGTVVLVWAAPAHDLPGFQSTAAYHPEAGWCVDELREVTHWQPLGAPPES